MRFSSYVRAALAMAWARAAAGQEFLGAEFPVNGSGVRPAVAGNATGAFVVAWESGTVDRDVFARRFGATGAPLGSEFRVNSTTTGSHDHPAVAMSSGGDFLVVWQDDSLIVRGQRYGSAGGAIGGEFQVNAFGNGGSLPRVAYLGSNAMVVAVSSTGLLYRVYDGAGFPLGSVTLCCAGASSGDVAADPARGRFVVGFSRGSSVYGGSFDVSGQPIDVEFRVDTLTNSPSPIPRLAAGPSGEFVVTWSGYAGTAASTRARRFDSTGSALGPEFKANLDDWGYRNSLDTAAVAADREGSLVVWPRYVSADDDDIRARHVPPGGELLVNTYTTGNQSYPSVAALAPGHFVVVWASDGQAGDWGIFGQRLSFRLSGDANGDGVLDVADVFYLINFLFAGGPAPVA